MKEKFKFLPQKERKKIMLICDDIRVHSGVATVATPECTLMSSQINRIFFLSF